MGVNLTPIVEKRIVQLDDLRTRSFAVDGNNVLYQFLALIRRPDGGPLTNAAGKVTSHLVGLLYRVTRLIAEYDLSLIFVFDGRPPSRKRRELEARRTVREKAAREYEAAVARGDFETAWSKAVSSSRLTRPMTADAQHLLTLLGIPWIQAPGEGEAQAAHLCRKGEVWAAATRDYDALLYGTPRLLRFLTVAGREYLPSQGTSRPLEPELIDLAAFLQGIGLTREQLIDVALLIGTDYAEGVRGVGPKGALRLIQTHGRLEDLPADLREQLPEDLTELRGLFLHPTVTEEYALHAGEPDEAGLIEFLVDGLDFSESRVRGALGRLTTRRSHPTLDQFGDP